MDEPSLPKYPEALVTLCRNVMSKYASAWPPEESKLAGDFVARFGLTALATFENQLELCESLGITVSEAVLPDDLRGHNCCYGNQREIQIHCGKFYLLTREHTLLHELREILEYIFRGMGFPTAGKKSALESRAEEFASSVRMRTFARTWTEIIEATEKIESNWRRRAASFLFFALGAAALLSIGMLPVVEDSVLDAD